MIAKVDILAGPIDTSEFITRVEVPRATFEGECALHNQVQNTCRKYSMAIKRNNIAQEWACRSDTFSRWKGY
jgi:hypothetical protein